MARFTVELSIDIDAATPEEAVEAFRAGMQSAYHAIPLTYHVEFDGGECFIDAPNPLKVEVSQ